MKKTNLFKYRLRKSKFLGKGYEFEEYQCPVCKQWFNSYHNSYNTMAVRMHITLRGKGEAVARQLGEIKKAPHFDLWKKYTRPVDNIYKPREWTVY